MKRPLWTCAPACARREEAGRDGPALFPDRFGRQVEVLSDLAGALGLDEQPQHVELARGAYALGAPDQPIWV
jgi:hypothetical protein